MPPFIASVISAPQHPETGQTSKTHLRYLSDAAARTTDCLTSAILEQMAAKNLDPLNELAAFVSHISNRKWQAAWYAGLVELPKARKDINAKLAIGIKQIDHDPVLADLSVFDPPEVQ